MKIGGSSVVKPKDKISTGNSHSLYFNKLQPNRQVKNCNCSKMSKFDDSSLKINSYETDGTFKISMDTWSDTRDSWNYREFCQSGNAFHL
jgi:hypothetical protein